MKLYLKIIVGIIIIASGQVYSQSSDSSKVEPYSKWPYFGSRVPSYVALTAGIETINSKYFLAGVSYNFGAVIDPPVGALVGMRMYYKQNMSDKKNYSFETDLCVLGGIAMGLNYNLNKVQDKNIHGFKPFIGISLYHIQFYYGYSFYNTKLDTFHQLTHNRFTISMNIPTFKFTKKK